VKSHRVLFGLVGANGLAALVAAPGNPLPKPVRERISIMSPLGFAEGADFEIPMTGWLCMAASKKALPAYPEIAKVPPGPFNVSTVRMKPTRFARHWLKRTLPSSTRQADTISAATMSGFG
jgi:hypothetical protein